MLGEIAAESYVPLVKMHVPKALVAPARLASGARLALNPAAVLLYNFGSVALEEAEDSVLGVYDDEAVDVLGGEHVEEWIEQELVLAAVVVDADWLGGDNDEGLHVTDAELVAGDAAREDGEHRWGVWS